MTLTKPRFIQIHTLASYPAQLKAESDAKKTHGKKTHGKKTASSDK